MSHSQMLYFLFLPPCLVSSIPPLVGIIIIFCVRQTPSMVVPLREGADRASATSLALRLSRLSLSQLLHNKGGIVVRERLVKGDSVRLFCPWLINYYNQMITCCRLEVDRWILLSFFFNALPFLVVFFSRFYQMEISCVFFFSF